METAELSWFVPTCAMGAKKHLDVIGRRKCRNTGGMRSTWSVEAGTCSTGKDVFALTGSCSVCPR